AEYWYRNLRETVRLHDATRGLLGEGYRSFIEMSPHPVLTVGVQETAEQALSNLDSVFVGGSLRREQGGLDRFLASLGEAWVRGVEVDWSALFAGSSPKRVKLPTYPFQRESYWLGSSASSATDVDSIGQTDVAHPLLSASVSLADGDGLLMTGRLSLETHPWLADHAAAGIVLLPGTALVELALRAGRDVGCDHLHELVLQAPVLVPEQGTLQLQVSVGEPDGSEARSVRIYSRPQGGSHDGRDALQSRWKLHAMGTLRPVEGSPGVSSVQSEAAAFAAETWPPVGAQAVPVDGLYERMAERGYDYGPVFQGLKAMWRRQEEIFAEVTLPEVQQGQVTRFGVHPALLDASLHSLGLALLDDAQDVDQQQRILLPFSFGGVELHGIGARTLRVRLTGTETISLVATDEHGELQATMDSLALKPIALEQLELADEGVQDWLFRLEWTALPDRHEDAYARDAWTLLGALDGELASMLDTQGGNVSAYSTVEALGEALGRGGTAAEPVLVDCLDGGLSAQVGDDSAGDVLDRVRAGVLGALHVARACLEDERFAGSRLVFVTRGAVACGSREELTGLADAPVWGLVRSAQSEHPGRFVLVDLDGESVSVGALARALALEEPQLAVRAGEVFVPRLARGLADGVLAVPENADAWRLGIGERGTLENLSLIAAPELLGPLGEGEIRIAVRAAGLNFGDVVDALGLIPPRPRERIVGEGAGVVLEVGEGVEGLVVGDRVLGVMPGAFGPIAVTDRRLVVRIPDGWSFERASSIPVAFLTAYYGLVDLAGVQSGESVLVHAAAGGVGMAAVQIARHLGAEVFGTASPGKWDTLRERGLDEAHIASSRTLEFGERFLRQTDGRGVDVVLDCLAREFVDASLELLAGGGRFVEMGKTDVRDPAEVGERHPGVAYSAFDLVEAGPSRIQEMLEEIVELFDRGVFDPLPVSAWDVRRAPEAFRHVSQARHVGKVVLRIPTPLDPAGTVLVTGGTGALGELLARHLVAERGVRSLVLASRSGPGAASAERLRAELETLGAHVEIVACDVSNRAEVQRLLGTVPAERPLTAVVHAAVVLEDGVLESLTDEAVERVLQPKVDAAWHLHELTRDLDLSAFVLFSSAAGTFGAAGQANYAAANVFLDGLAAQRRACGLPAVSIAWGLWAQAGEVSGHLDERDEARLARSGVGALSAAQGLELFDSATASDEALVVPLRLDLAALRAQSRAHVLPPLLRGLVRTSGGPAVREADGSLLRRLAGVEEHERELVLLDLIRAEVAVVLGHTSLEAIDELRAFKELGFDSLAGVELRNRLAAAIGKSLPSTLVFDYPTPATLASYLLQQLASEVTTTTGSIDAELDRLALAVSSVAIDETERPKVTARLRAILAGLDDARRGEDGTQVADTLQSATADEVFAFIDRELQS
ncbi:MAG: SDR family NAD(P)-dependent oxidoreductase, partial [Solirubrobacteraceae bacterium]